MNTVSLTGNLTKDPELKKTTDNISVADFTVACRRKYRKAGQPDADFISCRAWRQSADFLCRYGHKGDEVKLVGSIRTGSYTDRNGRTVYTTQVYTDDLELTSRRREEPQAKEEKPSFEEDSRMFGSSPDIGIETDDLPFY